MLIRDFLTEGRDQSLYHWMNPIKANSVFASDRMEARWTHRIDGRDVMGNSFTRNSHFDWGRMIRLTVDQTRLTQTNKIIPLDGEYVFSRTHGHTETDWRKARPFYMDRHAFSKLGRKASLVMAEEFVVGDINNLHRCLKQIEIHPLNVSGGKFVACFISAHGYAAHFDVPLMVTSRAQEQWDEIMSIWQVTDEEDDSHWVEETEERLERAKAGELSPALD